MTVAEMLARVSSRELSQWRAFELATGPLGTRYADQVLAELHELMQAFIAMQAAEDVPIKPYPRRDEFYLPTEDPDDEPVDWVEWARANRLS